MHLILEVYGSIFGWYNLKCFITQFLFLIHWALGDVTVILNWSSFSTLYQSKIDILSISWEAALRWMLQNTCDDSSLLDQVMAWCQCSPSSMMTIGTSSPHFQPGNIYHQVSNTRRILFSKQLNCLSLRCSWSNACRRCSNYIFILDLTPGFNGLGKDKYNMRRETSKFWDLVRLILETLRYMHKCTELSLVQIMMSLNRHQAVTWNNAALLLVRPSVTHLNYYSTNIWKYISVIV